MLIHEVMCDAMCCLCGGVFWHVSMCFAVVYNMMLYTCCLFVCVRCVLCVVQKCLCVLCVI